jgi:hypothetical protein
MPEQTWVTITKTDDGWDVIARFGEYVRVVTQGRKITVICTPDEDELPTPLAVTLEPTVPGG